MLVIAVCILIILLLVSISYIGMLQLQLVSVNKQLSKKLEEKSRQPISLELIDKRLNLLVANINKSFKAEELLRLESIREEKNFKELIANISHDLRTPLTAIKGYQQLLTYGDLDSKQRERLEIAQNHANELESLIEHFFEYSYLLNIEEDINLEKINITNFITECLAESVQVLEESGIGIKIKENKMAYIMGDREKLRRIIQNLIRNCKEHSAGDITVSISVNEMVKIIIENPINNPGEIDPSRIFDRFYTGDASRKKSTGLGLSIVKLLTEQMSGTVIARIIGNNIQFELKFYRKI